LGYDLITCKILKELPITGIKYPVLLEGYFRAQWKVAQVILILKPGKPPELKSYWPINLLPIVTKIFEKLCLKSLLKRVEDNGFTPIISLTSETGTPQ
jgi:hypothetical protein